MNDVSTARDIMTIEWEDPNMRLHGKRHKNDRYYFRWHYGKQRRVCMYTEYVDKPTENQKTARASFTALRKEVARQLHDPVLKARWQSKFQADNQGYKFIHTYVYAQLKAGVSITQSTTCRDAIYRVSASTASHMIAKKETRYMASLQADTQQETRHRRVPTGMVPILMLYNHTILPLFLPAHIPKTNHLRI